MEVNRDEYYSLSDIMNYIKSFLKYLCTKIWLLLLAALIGAGMGAVYYYKQKPKYDAICTFILEDNSGGGGGGLAGLASQFGFNIGSMGSGGGIFTGDNILNILKSKKVVQQVLLSKVNNNSSNNNTLADLYLEFTNIKKDWQDKPLLADISFSNKRTHVSPIMDSVLNVIYESIVKNNLFTERTSKQGTIIKVQVTASNALFARLMTERLVAEASNMYLDIRVGTYKENIKMLQRRADSLLLLLNNKSYHVAASQPLDINPGIRIASVPVEIATRDKTVLTTLFLEVTKNLEASKMLLSQQTPVIQLLDQPGYLLNDQKKSLFFLTFAGLIVTEIVFLLGTLAFFLLVRFKTQQSIKN